MVLSRPVELTQSCAARAELSEEWSPGVRILTLQQEQRGERRSGALAESVPPRWYEASDTHTHARVTATELATCTSLLTTAWDLGLLACDPRALTRWLYPVFARKLNRNLSCIEPSGQVARGASEYATYALTPRARDDVRRCVHVPVYDRNARSTRVKSSAASSWEVETEAFDCTVRQIFRNKHTNPRRFHLGTMDELGTFLLPLANRTDQGWSLRITPTCQAASSSAMSRS